ncbi:leucine-rich repeat-containing protein 3B-like [Parambassis ranga]|uniref:Leucine-rich repeat-containing protein 3B-like n=1 Tax=Parambassis ranga TaxID=210632 RepID=A0A6P7IXF1_9TELE|nr:leucine-rich repeat-containing protein 3B-like [Parambassis ranga]XP_028268189.1 leucine-rich repeat-containing protein 3B-like [Parambassis ranga]
MFHAGSLPLPPSSVEAVSLQRRLLLFLLLLILPSPSLVMTSSPLTLGLWRRSNTIKSCQWSEMVEGGLTVRCSGLKLTQVPVGLSNRTTQLFLNKNLLRSLPPNSFSDLFLLDELYLSQNQLSSLEAGCFSGLESSLHFLDLSSNQLSVLDPAAFSGLQVHANLTHNPWHCDCTMQLSMPQLGVDLPSLTEVVCQTSDLPNLGAVGVPLVILVEDWDLCLSVRRTADLLTLVTMLLWFFMVICYLVYYVKENKIVVQQHGDYLRFVETQVLFRGFKPS